MYFYKNCHIPDAGANSSRDKKFGFKCNECGWGLKPQTNLKNEKGCIDKVHIP
jgi:hypothetical protein